MADEKAQKTIYIDDVVNTVVDLVFKNWKSSATGVLTGAIACIIAVQALPPKSSKLVITAAVLNTLLALIKRDAGKTIGVKAGATSPSVVPAHEVPNDPTVKVTP